ncbi:hypothetical protein WAK64_16275 [Bacillus spongiae]|uniref:DUF2178 domain-containing protein n=1 Tax=Bacillus spongiae TaxID=2683610 RepID=A0ABU8HGU9_9BACI
MNFILLSIAMIVWLFSLHRLSKIKYSRRSTILQEAKQNVISLFWGCLIVLAIIFIPYQAWLLTGSSENWDGVYIFGGTIGLIIFVSLRIYYKRMENENEREC